jgi:hypothetical protein
MKRKERDEEVNSDELDDEEETTMDGEPEEKVLLMTCVDIKVLDCDKSRGIKSSEFIVFKFNTSFLIPSASPT